MILLPQNPYQETCYRKQVDDAPAEITFVEFNDRKTAANMVEEYSKRLQDTRSTGNNREQEAQPKSNVQGNYSEMRARKHSSMSVKTPVKENLD